MEQNQLEPFQFGFFEGQWAILTFHFVDGGYEFNLDILESGTYVNNLDDRLAKRLYFRNSIYPQLRNPIRVDANVTSMPESIETYKPKFRVFDIRASRKDMILRTEKPGFFKDFEGPVKKEIIDRFNLKITYGPILGQSPNSAVTRDNWIDVFVKIGFSYDEIPPIFPRRGAS